MTLIEEEELQSVEIHESNFLSTIRTRNLLETENIYDHFPDLPSGYEKLKMDFSKMIGKPFYAGRVTWQTTDPIGTLVRKRVPNDLLVSRLARIPFQSSALYRAKMSVVLQVSGTVSHQGTMLVSAYPGRTDLVPVSTVGWNSALCAPHVFLHPGSCTAVKLPIPFYQSSPLAMTDIDGNTFHNTFNGPDIASLDFAILNPLASGAGSTFVNIGIYLVFDYLEFYVPHYDPDWAAQSKTFSKTISNGADGLVKLGKSFTGDLIDSLRAGFKALTGLHNPNQVGDSSRQLVSMRAHNNVVDVPTQYERLDPFGSFNRVVDYPVFNTLVDEMDLRYLLSKPQLLSTITVDNKTASGSVIFARPICPYQQAYALNATFPGVEPTRLMVSDALNQNLSLMAHYWRGTIKIHIQSNMTSMHFARLAVARNYSPVPSQITKLPTLDSVGNLPFDILEFSGPGQIHTIELPFLSSMDRLPTQCTGFGDNGNFLGAYYIYLESPLVNSGTVSSSINFNIYMSFGDDFQLFGYNTTPFAMPIRQGTTHAIVVPDWKRPNTRDDFEAQSEILVTPVENPVLINTPRLNKPVNVGDVRPIESIRDFIRRPVIVCNDIYDFGEVKHPDRVAYYDLAYLMGQRFNARCLDQSEFITPLVNNNTATWKTINNHAFINQLFLGATGGVKLKIIVNGTNTAKVHYLPPKYEITKNYVIREGGTFPEVYSGIGLKPQKVRMVEDTSLLIPEYQYVQNIPFSPFNYSVMESIQLNSVQGYRNQNTSGSMTVCSESPTYNNGDLNHSIAAANFVGEKAVSQQAATSILDVEIPNISNFRFIGDSSKTMNLTNVSGMNTSTSNMGHLAVYLGATGDHEATVPPNRISICIIASYDDTCRMGYQTYSPLITLEPVVISDKVHQSQSSINTPYLRPSEGTNAENNTAPNNWRPWSGSVWIG